MKVRVLEDWCEYLKKKDITSLAENIIRHQYDYWKLQSHYGYDYITPYPDEPLFEGDIDEKFIDIPISEEIERKILEMEAAIPEFRAAELVSAELYYAILWG